MEARVPGNDHFDIDSGRYHVRRSYDNVGLYGPGVDLDDDCCDDHDCPAQHVHVTSDNDPLRRLHAGDSGDHRSAYGTDDARCDYDCSYCRSDDDDSEAVQGRQRGSDD